MPFGEICNLRDESNESIHLIRSF